MLNIAGMEISDSRAPMLFGHMSTAQIPILGHWDGFKKSGSAKRQKLRAVPHINVDGDDSLAETRKGIANLASTGVLTDVSVRWGDGEEEPVRRTNLPSDHWAAVDMTKEKKDAKRWGLFFPTSRLMEGSIVAIGADVKAKIGRAAGEMEDPFARMFIRSWVNESPQLPDHVHKILELRALLDSMEGVEAADLMNAVQRHIGEDLDLYEYNFGDGRNVLIPRAAYDLLVGDALSAWREAHMLNVRLADLSDEDEDGGESTEREEPEVREPIVQSTPKRMDSEELRDLMVGPATRRARGLVATRLGR
ncbi:MAG: hypothetical protein V3S43_03485 [Acidimicrobiia bacterium]